MSSEYDLYCCDTCGEKKDWKDTIIECVNCYTDYKWINVKESMPNKDGRYLVVEDFHYHKWIGVASLRDGKFDKGITHWMPLPDAPK